MQQFFRFFHAYESEIGTEGFPGFFFKENTEIRGGQIDLFCHILQTQIFVVVISNIGFGSLDQPVFPVVRLLTDGKYFCQERDGKEISGCRAS